MNLDPRIIEGKRVLTPFDIEEAEQFNGLSGYFSNVTDDFKHLENAARGVLILGFGETPYRYRNNDGEASTSGCLYFLPDAWVMKELNREIVLKRCHEVKRDLAHLYGKQKLLSENMWEYRGCYTEPGYSECGDRSIACDMGIVLKNAYDEYRKLLKDFEEGNY